MTGRRQDDTPSSPDTGQELRRTVRRAGETVGQAVRDYEFAPLAEETGRVVAVGSGVAWMDGLAGVTAEETVLIGPDKTPGLALDLMPGRVGVVLMGRGSVAAGDEVLRTGRILDVPVGDNVLGRVLDPMGRPLDDNGPVAGAERLPLEREAAPIMDRAPVSRPLQTGLKVVDAMIPVGRGQRQLILGDRQTGKTSLALDAIANQAGQNCICIYCAIGQRGAAVARAIEELRSQGAMDYTAVVAAGGDDPPGLVHAAPYAAASMAEYFMHSGRDVLVVYDDLSKHALAYRQISLLLRRPPGREAYPGDIFYIHSRLLERSTQLSLELGGGSMTALPVVETEAQNMSAFIPTNLVSITDGQILLTPQLFQKGILPAVDVGRSVSRVGGKAQLPLYRAVAGDLRLSYSQFEELEGFARFGTRLDDETRRTLERGRRVREVLKQDRFSPLDPARQAAVLLAAARGFLDTVPLDQTSQAQADIIKALDKDPALAGELAPGAPPSSAWERLESMIAQAVPRPSDDNENGPGHQGNTLEGKPRGDDAP